MMRTCRNYKRGKYLHWFKIVDGVLYRFYKSAAVDNGKVTKQVVVPSRIRQQVITVAHDSILAGHMGIKKNN